MHNLQVSHYHFKNIQIYKIQNKTTGYACKHKNMAMPMPMTMTQCKDIMGGLYTREA